MEEKVKKRGWVKNAAIIFLAVMLVLTFFSNTIMNRSLPEVATQYVTSGTINAKVRGTGTVTANENYEVTLTQSRKVESVLVKVGQDVSTGDVLFTLSSDASDELSSAEETLRQLKVNYQKALINASDTDYTKENRDIEKARQALQRAQEKRDALAISDADVAAIKAEVTSAKNAVTVKQAEVDKAQTNLESLGGQSSSDDSAISSLYSQMQSKKDDIKAAENGLETALLIYGTDYNQLVSDSTDAIKASVGYTSLSSDTERAAYIKSKLPIYLPAEAAKYSDPKDEDYKYYEAYEAITKCEDNITAAQAEYDALSSQYNSLLSQDNSYLYNKYNKALKEAQAALTDAQTVLSAKELKLSDAEKQQSDYQAADTEVDSCQTSLEDLLFAFEEQQKADGKNQQLEALDLQDMASQISKQQKVVDDLSGNAGGTEVVSKVNGTVQSINVTSGHSVEAGTALATIQIGDLGYSLSFSVTSEQARRVHVGDSATISNYYYGSEITAVVNNIKTDPQNPQSSKILVFDITGDVTVGSSLTISVGQKSAEYDLVVPNSAIRSDTNGSFVYIITAKNSPLGNRYIATRVDVTVITSDDTNSAVTGAVNAYDYVITTSTKPISNGDKVRMPD